MSQALEYANAAHAAGRLQQAKEFALRAVVGKPDSGEATLLLGVIEAKLNENSAALGHLGRAIDLLPDSVEARFWISILLRRMGRSEDAVELAKQAVALRPGDPYLRNNLGMSLMEVGDTALAAAEFQRSLDALPNSAPTIMNLGASLYQSGSYAEAASAFESASRLSPRDVEALLSLGQCKLSVGDWAAAERAALRALVLDPKSAKAFLIQASVAAELGHGPASEEFLRQALLLSPDDPEAHALIGQRLQSLGRFSEANEHLRRSLERRPAQGLAYLAYAYGNRIEEQDRPLVEQMRAVHAPKLAPRERMFLKYALGRSLEALCEYDEAMDEFDEANRIARETRFGATPFDCQVMQKRFDWLIANFPRMVSNVNGSDIPVFIVGMMRSGTTLAEQILGSHPRVASGGELPFWPLRSQQPDLAETHLRGSAKEYVEMLGAEANGARFVTDKMPSNFELLGPLHSALPNARFIHLRRDPADTCLSIYTTPNRVPISYAHDKENIAFAYRQYERLMDHWHRTLPTDRLLEVQYEEIVADPERQARKILDFLGLEWSDQMLRPETNRRLVVTPSLWQVRQPIYSGSVGRAGRFAGRLGAIDDLLSAG